MFRATLGFAIALTLLYGQGRWTLAPALAAVKADIAASHPRDRLGALLMPQTGTAAGAHRLHS
jgi:hypothetical protein